MKNLIQRLASRYLQASRVQIQDKTFWQTIEDETLDVAYRVAEREEKLTQPFDRRIADGELTNALRKLEEPHRTTYNRLLKTYLDRLEKAQDLSKLESLKKEVRQQTHDLMALFKADQHFEGLFDVVTYLQDFEEMIDAQLKKSTPKQPEEYFKEFMDGFRKDYQSTGLPRIKKLQEHIEKFCQATQCPFDFILTPDAQQDANYMWNVTSPTVHVKMTTPDKPGFTIFSESGNRYDVDDVLSVGDRDFFNAPEEEQTYFDLVSFLRTGDLPKEKKGFIKLYRGMSNKEFQDWQHGHKIPRGKYFTSSKSAALAQDVLGEYPELFTFMVDASIVRETDPKTFQLVKDAQMTPDKKIIPYH